MTGWGGNSWDDGPGKRSAGRRKGVKGSYRHRDKDRISEGTLPVQAVMAAVSQQLGLDNKVKEFALFGLWKSVAEPPFRDGIVGQRLRRQGTTTTLVVQVPHAAMASELAFHTPRYCQQLNTFAPQTGIVLDAIAVEVAP